MVNVWMMCVNVDVCVGGMCVCVTEEHAHEECGQPAVGLGVDPCVCKRVRAHVCVCVCVRFCFCTFACSCVYDQIKKNTCMKCVCPDTLCAQVTVAQAHACGTMHSVCVGTMLSMYDNCLI